MTTQRDLPPEIFQINTGTNDPIYKQMIEQLRRLVAGGQVRAGDGMPSVREVASALGVNPMTVSKAYSLLEGEGLLARRRGLGMMVAERSPEFANQDSRLALLRPSLERIAVEAQQLEIKKDAVMRLFEEILREKK